MALTHVRADTPGMFCPKCGLENGDEAKFCRGCGANLGGVLASLEGKPKRPLTVFDDTGKPQRSLEERAVILQSRAIRGAITSFALLMASALLLFVAPPSGILWLAALTLGLIVLAGTIARATQASGYRKLAAKQQPAELGAGKQEFMQPPRSIYDTDDLAATPFSVTERTTNLLRRVDEDEDLID